jgi:hypothetical protein
LRPGFGIIKFSLEQAKPSQALPGGRRAWRGLQQHDFGVVVFSVKGSDHNFTDWPPLTLDEARQKKCKVIVCPLCDWCRNSNSIAEEVSLQLMRMVLHLGTQREESGKRSRALSSF